ncbi:hypothetical protein PHLCEN_2v8494 [Hermanssonia centrifuga]|uniref:Uncharacterized protein n=1 Tax=Hermanssonia centrifuga TaxID=98765 RepID=A0A2R6NU79_9APHY|nr:hypothetical protein PHLCEN_2v8494 [Hermanssonia centrifuga]
MDADTILYCSPYPVTVSEDMPKESDLVTLFDQVSLGPESGYEIPTLQYPQPLSKVAAGADSTPPPP